MIVWPKLFQNFRSTHETELAEQYPVQVVCVWIGNSPVVAAKHYLQVHDEHFLKAGHFLVQKVAISGDLDPDLQRVIDAWPTLSETVRREIVIMVETRQVKK